MTGYVISPSALCAEMRKRGIPNALQKAKLGRTWMFYDPRRRDYVAFFLNHDAIVPIDLWKRMSPKDHQQFPLHQWPEITENQSS